MLYYEALMVRSFHDLFPTGGEGDEQRRASMVYYEAQTVRSFHDLFPTGGRLEVSNMHAPPFGGLASEPSLLDE